MFLFINKPAGWTSHDVVAYIRKKYSKNIKIGHAGTLDPFATGLLIVGVGRESTKKLDEFKALPKTYVATLKLGYISETFDKTGKIKPYRTTSLYHLITSSHKKISLEKINKILNKFLGQQKQLPPMY